MRKGKRITAVLLGVLVLIMLLPAQTLAAGSIDLGRDVSLTVSYSNGGAPLVGARFNIYLVATVDDCGELTTTDTFEQFNVNIRGKNDEAWKTLASTLEGYVLRDRITLTDSGETDGNGAVCFPVTQESLRHGLYLVLAQRHLQGGYIFDAAPFMVLLPGIDMEANEWVYDVTVSPKHDSELVDEEPSPITRKVLKVWEDDGHENDRPQEITVQLLRDGEIYDTVTLNAGNNWRYTWENLDGNYKWTVVETETDGYTVEVTQEGITFVVTNTYTESEPDEPPVTDQPPTPTEPGGPENPDDTDTPTEPVNPGQSVLPQTGQLWWPVPALAAAGLLLIILGLLRRRGAGNEE